MKIKVKIFTSLLVILFTLGAISCSEKPVETDKSNTVLSDKLVVKDKQTIKSYAKFVPIREDDFAWENDLVAFRMYGPSSLATPTNAASGVDCWLKRVNYSIIDQWYQNFQNQISYHKDWGEGHDHYHTGISRGTGGTALWIDGTPYPSGTFNAWRIVDDNPEKVVFELDYIWQTQLGEVAETKQISLALGSQLFNVTSRFFLNGQPAKGLSVAIGVTTHDGAATVSSNKNQGWIAAWEKLQGYYLGTGVVVRPELVDEIIHSPSTVKDQSHIWLISHTNDQGELSYSAGYGWQRGNLITTEIQWQEYLASYSAN